MIGLYAAAFFTALGSALALTPACIWLAHRFQILDKPDPRKIHTEPKPRLGGLGIIASLFISLGLLKIFSKRFGWLLDYAYRLPSASGTEGVLSLEHQLAGILLATTVILVLGLMDDRKGVRASVKLLTEIIAAYIAITYGVRILGISLPGISGYVPFPLWLTQIITVMWLIGMTNAINLIDGLDGLAAGIAAIVAGTFLVVAILQGESHALLFAKQLKLAGILSAGLMGACIGFLVYNFYPSKIFMGDGGALSIGFILGTIAVIGTFKTPVAAVLLIPIVVVALPVTDMALAVIRRFRNKKRLFKPDRSHIHHWLLDRGWTQREIVLLMYVITLLLSIASILLAVYTKQ